MDGGLREERRGAELGRLTQCRAMQMGEVTSRENEKKKGEVSEIASML